jgi:hypothetical protein
MVFACEDRSGKWVPAPNALVSEDEVRFWGILWRVARAWLGEPAEFQQRHRHVTIVIFCSEWWNHAQISIFQVGKLIQFGQTFSTSKSCLWLLWRRDFRNIGHVITLTDLTVATVPIGSSMFQCTNNHQLVSTTSRIKEVDQNHLGVQMRLSMGSM